MSNHGGYCLFRISDITPSMPLFWAELIQVRGEYPADHWSLPFTAWICDVRPEDATVEHIIRYCGEDERWAAILTHPTVFAAPMLRLSDGDNLPSGYGIADVWDAIARLPDGVFVWCFAERTW
jgi:hypothetical protein